MEKSINIKDCNQFKLISNHIKKIGSTCYYTSISDLLENNMIEKYSLNEVIDTGISIVEFVLTRKDNLDLIINNIQKDIRLRCILLLYAIYIKENYNEHRSELKKYRNAFNVGDSAKNILKIINYTTDLKINLIHSCIRCNEKTMISLEFDNLPYGQIIDTKCPNCGHKIYYEIGSIRGNSRLKLQSYCNCNKCSSMFNELFNLIDIPKIESELYDLVNKVDYNTEINEEQVYKLNKNYLTKTERALLDLKPTSYGNLNSMLDEMSKMNRSIKKNKVFNNLINHGIIIPSFLKSDFQPSIEKVINECIDFKKSTKNRGEITSYSTYNNSLILSTKEITTTKRICRSYSLHTDTLCYIDERYTLNKHYINDVNLNEELNFNPKYNVFASPIEKTIYHELKCKYKDYIIIPNATLCKYCPIYDIKDDLSKMEFNYLKTCIVDFLIANSEGNVCQVLEVQRGKHHDEIDWVKKDNIKKHCCSLLGISFKEEY